MYIVRAFLRLWRWRRDLTWRRELVLDTLRGRLPQRVDCRLIRLEDPVSRPLDVDRYRDRDTSTTA